MDNIVWWKLDLFSDWKLGRIVSMEGDYYNIQKLKIDNNNKSEISETITRVHKKFVEPFSDKSF